MRLDILNAHTERYMTITATRVSADLAVHRRLVPADGKFVPGSDWTITHIVSGLRFFKLRSKAEAVACAKTLAHLDWSGKDVRVLVRRLRPAVAEIAKRFGLPPPRTPERWEMDDTEYLRRRLQKERARATR